jgi:hypothetical protein
MRFCPLNHPVYNTEAQRRGFEKGKDRNTRMHQVPAQSFYIHKCGLFHASNDYTTAWSSYRL